MLEAVVGDFVCADVRSCIVSRRPRFALRQAQGRLSAGSRGGCPHMSLPIARTVAVGTCFGLLLVVPHVRRADGAFIDGIARMGERARALANPPPILPTLVSKCLGTRNPFWFILSRRLSTSMRNCAQSRVG